MRKRAVWLLVIAIGANAPAHAGELPLFEALKTFCVDTGAEPKAVTAAVKQAGGVPSDPPGGYTDHRDATGPWFPIIFTAWDMTFWGHRMTLNTGTGFLSRAPSSAKKPDSDFYDCSIRSWVNEDESIAAIRKWVGVEPDHESQIANFPPDLIMYSYQTVGESRRQIANRAELISAQTEGRAWRLVLMRSRVGASFQLTRTVPTSKSP